MQCGKTAGRLSTVTMDYQLKRYLSKFTALAVGLRKKWERQQNNNKKNQVAIENAKKQQQKKGTGQFQNLKWFLCLPFLPCFPRVSLHQSSTNILPQMIYQMFAKAEVSTGSYTLSMTLCGNYSQLNINIEQSLYQKVEEIIVPLFWKAQHWIHFLYWRLN